MNGLFNANCTITSARVICAILNHTNHISEELGTFETFVHMLMGGLNVNKLFQVNSGFRGDGLCVVVCASHQAE